jgi:hypothetical protein
VCHQAVCHQDVYCQGGCCQGEFWISPSRWASPRWILGCAVKAGAGFLQVVMSGFASCSLQVDGVVAARSGGSSKVWRREDYTPSNVQLSSKHACRHLTSLHFSDLFSLCHGLSFSFSFATLFKIAFPKDPIVCPLMVVVISVAQRWTYSNNGYVGSKLILFFDVVRLVSACGRLLISQGRVGLQQCWLVRV